MRCEFLCDAIILRYALSPWVVGWKDEQWNDDDEHGVPKRMRESDRSIEFLVSEDAPRLNHLRWLINQITDMHVAAESLNYAEHYDESRLSYKVIERITPPQRVIKKMFEALSHLDGLAPSLLERLMTAKTGCSMAGQASG